jgi:spore maturation protein CgeB
MKIRRNVKFRFNKLILHNFSFPEPNTLYKQKISPTQKQTKLHEIVFLDFVNFGIKKLRNMFSQTNYLLPVN